MDGYATLFLTVIMAVLRLREALIPKSRMISLNEKKAVVCRMGIRKAAFPTKV
jgi:DNA-directed RNA polymerase subunit H (RpoH/RPB5)